MSVETVARAHQRSINNITAAAVFEADKAWAVVDVDNLDASWRVAAPRATAIVGAAQVAVAARSDNYLTGLAGARGIDDNPLGRVNPDAFRDFTGSGVPLAAYLGGAVGAVKGLIGKGWAPAEALRSGRKLFANTITTTVGDQSRQAVSASMGVRASGLRQGWVGGYTRMVSPGACARCLILAGKRFQTEEAFARHPGCLCTHIPSAENVDDDPATDPHAAFESMTEAEQNERFGKANAEAIRQGADIFQVVNATDSGSVYSASGNRFTRSGTTRRGAYGASQGSKVEKRPGNRYSTANRLRATPETIMKRAANPEEVVRLLKLYKYIL